MKLTKTTYNGSLKHKGDKIIKYKINKETKTPNKKQFYLK